MKNPLRHQRGAVLAIGLILLLVMTLLGSMSISRVSTSERLAGNERDINNAFQAAESALVEGERWINDLTTATPPTAVTNCADAGGCEIAVWDATDPTNFSLRGNQPWSRLAWDGVARSYGFDSQSDTLARVAEPPRYVLEYLGAQAGASATSPQQHYFRITARASGTTPASEVILQSVYRRTFP